MKAKILTIIIISILLCSCTELPNLNWEAASESLSQTSKDLVMIKMAEEGFPYWLYMYPYSMNPYSMNWMNFIMWDQMLHERQAEMNSSLFRYENLLREIKSQYRLQESQAQDEYDDLLQEMKSQYMLQEEQKKEAEKDAFWQKHQLRMARLLSEEEPLTLEEKNKEEKKELLPWPSPYPRPKLMIGFPPRLYLLSDKEEWKRLKAEGEAFMQKLPDLFAENKLPEKEKNKEEKKEEKFSADLFKEETKIPYNEITSYKTAIVLRNIDWGGIITVKLPNNLILKLKKIQRSNFHTHNGDYVRIVIKNSSMIWLCNGTKICKFMFHY